MFPTQQSPSLDVNIAKLRTHFATFGLLEIIVSDNGPAFVSVEFKDIFDKNGLHLLTTAPCHTASYGLAERACQIAKQDLLKQTPGDTQARVGRLLFGYHSTPNETTGLTTADIILIDQCGHD